VRVCVHRGECMRVYMSACVHRGLAQAGSRTGSESQVSYTHRKSIKLQV